MINTGHSFFAGGFWTPVTLNTSGIEVVDLSRSPQALEVFRAAGGFTGSGKDTVVLPPLLRDGRGNEMFASDGPGIGNGLAASARRLSLRSPQTTHAGGQRGSISARLAEAIRKIENAAVLIGNTATGINTDAASLIQSAIEDFVHEARLLEEFAGEGSSLTDKAQRFHRAGEIRADLGNRLAALRVKTEPGLAFIMAARSFTAAATFRREAGDRHGAVRELALAIKMNLMADEKQAAALLFETMALDFVELDDMLGNVMARFAAAPLFASSGQRQKALERAESAVSYFERLIAKLGTDGQSEQKIIAAMIVYAVANYLVGSLRGEKVKGAAIRALFIAYRITSQFSIGQPVLFIKDFFAKIGLSETFSYLNELAVTDKIKAASRDSLLLALSNMHKTFSSEWEAFESRRAMLDLSATESDELEIRFLASWIAGRKISAGRFFGELMRSRVYDDEEI